MSWLFEELSLAAMVEEGCLWKSEGSDEDKRVGGGCVLKEMKNLLFFLSFFFLF